MLFSRRSPRVAASAGLAAVAVATSVAVAVASQDNPSDVPPATSSALRTLDAFGAFKQAPAANLPSQLQAFIAEPSTQDKFALDASKARAVGDSSRPWYLIPGKDSLCFYDAEGGGSCSTIAEAAEGRLMVRLVPHAQSPGPGKLEGIVPDGVDSIRVTNADGTTHTAPVTNGIYTVTTANPKSVEFVGANAPAPLRAGG